MLGRRVMAPMPDFFKRRCSRSPCANDVAFCWLAMREPKFLEIHHRASGKQRCKRREERNLGETHKV